MSEPELKISLEDLKELEEYSLSVPTDFVYKEGQIIPAVGRRWRKREGREWKVCEYVRRGTGYDIKWYWAVDENGEIHLGDL